MRFLIAMAAILWLLPNITTAQSDKQAQTVEIRNIYKEAMSKLSSTECLKLAKTLMDKGVKAHDGKAQCMAAQVPMLYYYSKGSDNEFDEAIEQLKKVAKQNNRPRFYYFAYQYQVLRLSNSGRAAEALRVAEQMQKEALSEQDTYGISLSYKALADVYFGRSDYPHAKEYYLKGLEYNNKNKVSSDLTVYYAMLAMVCRNDDDYEGSLKYSNLGLKYTQNKQSIARLELSKAYSLFLLGRHDEFLQLLKVVDTKTNMYGSAEMDTYYLMKVQEAILEKKYDEALKWANKPNYELNRLEQQGKVYKAMGNWEKAYECYEQSMNAKSKRMEQLHSKDLAEANAKFKNERLQSENLRLELLNANGKLEAAKSMAKQKEMDAQNAKLEAYNKELKLHNSDLTLAQFRAENSLKKSELERQKAELERQKAQADKEFSKHHWQQILLIGGIFALLLIIISLIRNRQSYKKFIKTLKQKNDELAIERDKAQQSEKMKTMFIQNVSHEIRTPLNAIVGFSDLMLNPEMELDNTERENFKNIIHQNSDLLTGLVNDVLTLSELQSGKAKLNINECKCNALCRSALDTVAHRKPKDVELLFTTDVDDSFTIKSDSRRISQVVINFLTNAEKYTNKGTITLDCSANKKPGYITFTVTDTGCGIPQEKQTMVFDRFEKLDDFHQGIGLGLNICALIANLLDAQIGIDSDYTNGARFYLTIKR